MKEQKERIKLSQLREIAVLASVIPMYRKAMGYRSDSAIASLAAHVKGQIEYEIGEELAAIREKVVARVQEISAPFQQQARDLNSDGEQLLEITRRLNEAISLDEQIKAISQQEDVLWRKEITKDVIPVEVELLDYSERFPDEIRTVHLFGREHKQDGYAALLQLHTMGLITYRDEQ